MNTTCHKVKNQILPLKVNCLIVLQLKSSTFNLNNLFVTDSDTKVTNTLNTTAKAYVTGTTSDKTNTGTQVFDTGVYLDKTAGQLVAKTFKGALSGNATSATNASKVNGRHSSRIPTLNASGVLWDADAENTNDAFIQWDGSTYFKLKTQHNKTMVDNADTVDGYHASNFLRNSMTVALSDNFTTERVVGNDSSLPLYREYIRQTADGTTVNKIFRLFSPSGKYSDLSIQCKNDVFTWGFAGTGTTDVTLNGKSVLTSANLSGAGYKTGILSYSSSTQTVTLGFKPSFILACEYADSSGVSNISTNIGVVIDDNITYINGLNTYSNQVGITKTSTGFTAKFLYSQSSGTPPTIYIMKKMLYIAFK